MTSKTRRARCGDDPLSPLTPLTARMMDGQTENKKGGIGMLPFCIF
jgi:hypothetical protein